MSTYVRCYNLKILTLHFKIKICNKSICTSSENVSDIKLIINIDNMSIYSNINANNTRLILLNANLLPMLLVPNQRKKTVYVLF